MRLICFRTFRYNLAFVLLFYFCSSQHSTALSILYFLSPLLGYTSTFFQYAPEVIFA